METEELVDRLMAEIYHAPIQHPDSVVQERIVKSNLYNLLEDFEKALRDQFEEEIEELKAEVGELESQLETEDL